MQCWRGASPAAQARQVVQQARFTNLLAGIKPVSQSTNAEAAFDACYLHWGVTTICKYYTNLLA